ncbi:FtsX-like permease family protein [Kineosporia sp. A_224]|uniref:FtsX-like permease family protein n=1 Tax=Kineosporia sp. A_224 TaxID=1962180 RepID=UPI000B4AA837|nr:FtsX-like permease family protein [Kineosporia sp. A_224]
MLALLWRAVRWRRATSLAVLAASVVATAAGTLGPLYARSAEESLLRQRVAQAPAVQVGLTVEAQLGGPGRLTGDMSSDPTTGQVGPPVVADAARAVAADHRLDRWFGPPSAFVELDSTSLVLDGGSVAGLAQPVWLERACEGLQMDSGTCSPGPGQVLVSRRTAQTFRLAVGSQVRLSLAARPLRVAGVYADVAAAEAVWGARSPIQWTEPRQPDDVLKVDAVLVARDDIDDRTLGGAAGAYRPLRRDTILLSTTGPVVADVAAVDRDLRAVGGRPAGAVRGVAAEDLPPMTLTNQITDLLAEVAPQRRDLRGAALAITLQLVALAWFVLFLVVATTTEERSAEVALAKLRGLSLRRTAVLALAEACVLLLAAAPVGLALSYLVVSRLVEGVLQPGTSVTLDRTVWLALAAAVVGGLVAAALATARLLTAPVLDQLRRTAGGRAARLRGVAVDAVALVLAAEGVYLLRTGVSGAVALATPALLALAGGLVAVRVLPFVARLAVASTRGRPGAALFLAARNLARRPAGSRVSVLLAVAVALAVFGVQEWRIAQEARFDLARTQVPAAQVVHVAALPPWALAEVVGTVDPEGTWAMAAVSVDGTLAVDSPRFAAVSAWDPAWVGTTPAGLARVLRPPVDAAPVTARDTLTVTVDDALPARSSKTSLGARLIAPDGTDRVVTFGALARGTRDYTVRLPSCADGCRLLRLTLDVDPFGDVQPSGTVTVTRMSDAGGPVDAGLSAPGGWRLARTASLTLDPSRVRPQDVATSAAGLVLTVTDGTGPAAEPADHPADPPAVLGDRASYSPYDSGSDAPTVRVAGLDSTQLVVTATGRRGPLPVVGRAGALVDLRNAVDSAAERRWSEADAQVWLSPAAPPDAVRRLGAAGLSVRGVDSLAERQAVLDGDGTSLALVLYLVAAVAALLAGGGALLASTYLGGRRRAYELAAARLLGARRSSLVAAGRVEQLVLVLLGVLVGGVTGAAATWLVLDALPAVTGGSEAVRAYGVRWPLLLAVTGAAALVAAAFSELGARRVVAAADTGLLRQVQA